MGILIPGKRFQNRRFSYEPRYYNPRKEESIRRRLRIQGRSQSRRRRGPATAVYFAILLILALYIYTRI